MANSEGSSLALTFVPTILRDENVLACEEVNDILSDFELDSKHGPVLLSSKICTELRILEIELDNSISIALNCLSKLKTEINDVPRKVDSTVVDNAHLFDDETVAQKIQIIDKLTYIIQEDYKKTLQYRETQAKIDSYLRVGGYRSLLISFLDTLKLITSALHNPENLIAKPIMQRIAATGKEAGRSIRQSFMGTKSKLNTISNNEESGIKSSNSPSSIPITSSNSSGSSAMLSSINASNNRKNVADSMVIPKSNSNNSVNLLSSQNIITVEDNIKESIDVKSQSKETTFSDNVIDKDEIEDSTKSKELTERVDSEDKFQAKEGKRKLPRIDSEPHLVGSKIKKEKAEENSDTENIAEENEEQKDDKKKEKKKDRKEKKSKRKEPRKSKERKSEKEVEENKVTQSPSAQAALQALEDKRKPGLRKSRSFDTTDFGVTDLPNSVLASGKPSVFSPSNVATTNNVAPKKYRSKGAKKAENSAPLTPIPNLSVDMKSVAANNGTPLGDRKRTSARNKGKILSSYSATSQSVSSTINESPSSPRSFAAAPTVGPPLSPRSISDKQIADKSIEKSDKTEDKDKAKNNLSASSPTTSRKLLKTGSAFGLIRKNPLSPIAPRKRNDLHSSTNNALMTSSSPNISSGEFSDDEFSEGTEDSSALREAKRKVSKYYQAERERTKAEKEKEIENLRAMIRQLEKDEKEELKRLDKEEREKLKALDKDPKYCSKEIFAKKLKEEKMKMKQIKHLVQLCEDAFAILENLMGKIAVASSIKPGDLFRSINELYELHPEEDPQIVFASHHLGYELDKDLKEYSKKMKVVYCAVGDRRKNAGANSSFVVKQMQFSYAAVRYFLSPKQASEQYGDLRANLDVQFVREVWDLLEDPVTSFFATQFGLVASTGRMSTNLTVRVPVPISEIYYQVSEHQIDSMKDRNLKLTSSGETRKKNSKGIIVISDEEKKALEMASSNDSLTSSSSLEELPNPTNLKESDEEVEKLSCSGEKNNYNSEVNLEINVRNGFSNNEEGIYRIRCVYVSQSAREVDPSLVLKVGERANFIENEQIIKKSVHRSTRSASVTNIFRNRMEKGNDKVERGEKNASPVSESEEASEVEQNVLILHIHGGGWVSQSPGQHLPYVSEWARYARVPVLSIDYSLSPETQFPIPVNECYAVYKWLQDPVNVKKLGLPIYKDPLRIIVSGDSAGGNLTCAVTLRAIEENIRPPIGLLLHYPAVNLSEAGSLSRLIFSNDPILNYQTMRVVLKCYLGDHIDKADDNPFISPAMAPDEMLAKFPPTVICVGDVDPLIDDSTYLYSRLRDLQIRTILRVYRALPHGYLNLPTQLPKANNAIKDAGVYISWLIKEYQATQQK